MAFSSTTRKKATQSLGVRKAERWKYARNAEKSGKDLNFKFFASMKTFHPTIFNSKEKEKER